MEQGGGLFMTLPQAAKCLQPTLLNDENAATCVNYFMFYFDCIIEASEWKTCQQFCSRHNAKRQRDHTTRVQPVSVTPKKENKQHLDKFIICFQLLGWCMIRYDDINRCDR
nr:unnamed protein product [Callosobruchus chinensis]